MLLKDMVKIDDDWIEMLRNSKYVPYNSELYVESEARAELRQYSNVELIAYLNKSDEVSD